MTDAQTPRLHSRRRAAAVAAIAVSVLVAAVVGVTLAGGDDGDARAETAQPAAVAEVRRQDLVETETVDGTLGYSDARRVESRLAGTVTWMPKAGAVVRINEPLYEVDGRKVYLMDGIYPAYRVLRPGLTGDDVRQLERNLRRLGFDKNREMRVDGTWDAGTTAAVRRWQQSTGIDDDGSIEWGRIVFQPGDRRIRTISAPAGTGVGAGQAAGPAPSAAASEGASGQQGATPVMTTTSTKRIVTLDLETTQADLAAKGAPVGVEMPDGKDLAGTIVRVARIAQKKKTMEDDDPPATIKVIIRLQRNRGVDLDQAPVDVRLEKNRVKGVLTIPVTALLARQGGTFAVEVRDGDRRRIVPVETGLYTDGDVEIEGAGLSPGLKVTDARV
jgi:peptidoglycan hydrolase-like protein with peptidoglycan-binding domain